MPVLLQLLVAGSGPMNDTGDDEYGHRQDLELVSTSGLAGEWTAYVNAEHREGYSRALPYSTKADEGKQEEYHRCKHP